MSDNDIVKKCASCFVIDNNSILLIFHKKFGKYLQPGGHIEGDEEPYQTAIREVLEETGIEIIIDDKIPFNIEVYDTKIGRQLDYQFVGRPINKDIKKNEESYLCAWFDIDDLNNIDVVDDLKEKIKMIKSR
jgi:8-oxo-dGTP pyrophosphatase MutT (NUDIX family)